MSCTTLRSLQLGMSWLPEQPGNGLDRMFYGLAQHLPAAGVEVEGLVAGSPSVEVGSGARVRAFAPPRAPVFDRLGALRKAVRHTLARQHPDIVASHFALYTLPALDLLRRHPLVVHFHGPWAEESRVEGSYELSVAIKYLAERLVYRSGARFVTLSTAFARVLERSYGIDPDRIRVVAGGVASKQYAPAASREALRRRLGWPAERPILLTVRRLVHRVGLENLVDSFPIVLRREPEALLYIAGKGPLQPALEQRIKALGLERRVRLLGYVSDAALPMTYAAATLSVVPSVALEGFGLVTVESLAAGTPALVSPVGGLPEVVAGLDPQLVLPNLQPEVMGDHLGAALRGDIALPNTASCMAYARANFDWAVIAQRTRVVYEEALHA